MDREKKKLISKLFLFLLDFSKRTIFEIVGSLRIKQTKTKRVG